MFFFPIGARSRTVTRRPAKDVIPAQLSRRPTQEKQHLYRPGHHRAFSFQAEDHGQEPVADAPRPLEPGSKAQPLRGRPPPPCPRPSATPSEPPWLRRDETGPRWRLWGGGKDRHGGIKKRLKMSLRCCLREHDPVPESRCPGPGGEALCPAACGVASPQS